MKVHLDVWIFTCALSLQLYYASANSTVTDPAFLNLILENSTYFEKELNGDRQNFTISDSSTSNTLSSSSTNLYEECETGKCQKNTSSYPSPNSSSSFKILWNLVSTSSSPFHQSTSNKTNDDNYLVSSNTTPSTHSFSQHSSVHSSSIYSNDNELDSKISFENIDYVMHSDDDTSDNADSFDTYWKNNFTASTEFFNASTEDISALENSTYDLEEREYVEALMPNSNASDVANLTEFSPTTLPPQSTTLPTEDELDFTTYFLSSDDLDEKDKEINIHRLDTERHINEKPPTEINHLLSSGYEYSTPNAFDSNTPTKHEVFEAKDAQSTNIVNSEISTPTFHTISETSTSGDLGFVTEIPNTMGTDLNADYFTTDFAAENELVENPDESNEKHNIMPTEIGYISSSEVSEETSEAFSHTTQFSPSGTISNISSTSAEMHDFSNLSEEETSTSQSDMIFFAQNLTSSHLSVDFTENSRGRSNDSPLHDVTLPEKLTEILSSSTTSTQVVVLDDRNISINSHDKSFSISTSDNDLNTNNMYISSTPISSTEAAYSTNSKEISDDVMQTNYDTSSSKSEELSTSSVFPSVFHSSETKSAFEASVTSESPNLVISTEKEENDLIVPGSSNKHSNFAQFATSETHIQNTETTSTISATGDILNAIDAGVMTNQAARSDSASTKPTTAEHNFSESHAGVTETELKNGAYSTESTAERSMITISTNREINSDTIPVFITEPNEVDATTSSRVELTSPRVRTSPVEVIISRREEVTSPRVDITSEIVTSPPTVEVMVSEKEVTSSREVTAVPGIEATTYPASFDEVSSSTVAETHRAGKHIPFSSTLVKTTTTTYPIVYNVTVGTHPHQPESETTGNGVTLLYNRIEVEKLSLVERSNLINAVVILPDKLYSEDELNEKILIIHLWLLHAIADEYKNASLSASGASDEQLDEVEFENLPQILYVLPSPEIYPPNISLTFVVNNQWRNVTYPVDIILTILNLHTEDLKHLIEIEEVHISHGLLLQKPSDLLSVIIEKYGIVLLATCIITVTMILLLLCVVIYYRRKNRHSAHCLTDDKLHRNMQEAMGIDLNPAVIILQDEIREKAALNGNKINSLDDDEGWLAPIGDVPVAEDKNAPFVQDTKL